MTTNYDDPLERAFDEAGEPFDVVWYDGGRRAAGAGSCTGRRTASRAVDRAAERVHGLALDERPVILKIHGAVDRGDPERDSYVITEDHYIDYLRRTRRSAS